MAAADQSEDLVPVREAAVLVGVPRTAINRWIRYGLLPSQPHVHGQRVSVAAARAVAEATVHQPRPRAGPREDPDDDADYVPVCVAARAVGVSDATVAKWARTAMVARKPHRHGQLVCLADVQEMVAQAQAPHSCAAPRYSRGRSEQPQAEPPRCPVGVPCGETDLLLVREAAEQLQVSQNRLYYWIETGRLPAQRLGPGRMGVRRADVQGVLAALGAPALAPQPEDFVSPTVAARLVGVPAQRVHHWHATGKVASKPSRRGRLVRLVDVQEMAAQAPARQRSTPPAD
jgi:excisionase family DNA binding protein